MSLYCPEPWRTWSSLARPNCSLRKTNTVNEISSKRSSTSQLKIDYDWGAVFPTSALISAEEAALSVFIGRGCCKAALLLRGGMMCRVPIRCDTFCACYSFLIRCVKVTLSLCLFYLSSRLFRLAVTLVAPSLFSPSVYSVCFIFSVNVNVVEVSPICQLPKSCGR